MNFPLQWLNHLFRLLIWTHSIIKLFIDSRWRSDTTRTGPLATTKARLQLSQLNVEEFVKAENFLSHFLHLALCSALLLSQCCRFFTTSSTSSCISRCEFTLHTTHSYVRCRELVDAVRLSTLLNVVLYAWMNDEYHQLSVSRIIEFQMLMSFVELSKAYTHDMIRHRYIGACLWCDDFPSSCASLACCSHSLRAK